MATSKHPLFSSRPSAHARLGDAFGGSRVYDYTMKYPPDQLGEEHKENARVWNIYLDEAENHDRDMLQGFREIIDGVLIFASLFSAVVTTLVAQTSQALQPDNAQIMVSLLVENNQLLRAAGNSTTINDVPKSTLSPGSVIYTSKDVWVNALFFASLGLSLSTALLTVLVKQWLHAYSSFITGDAQRRAFVTHFRSEGLRTWRMRQIVEALPLILHGSVLVFFVGLVLYVSQLSTPICGILASITALSFAFYVGSSFLPAVFIACPYRIPVLFDVGQSFLIFIHSIGVAVLSLVILARGFVPSQLWSLCEWKLAKWKSKIHQRPLEIEEIDAIFSQSHTAFNVLQQLLQTTSQRTTQQVVLEAVFALLLEFEKPEERRSVPLEIQQPFEHPLVWETFRLSLFEFVDLNMTTKNQGDLHESTKTWENRISFLDERVQVESGKKISLLLLTFWRADLLGNEHACSRILDWIGTPALEDASNTAELLRTVTSCTGNGVRQILKRTTTILSAPYADQSLLHHFVWVGNLDAAKAVVEADHSDEVVNSISLRGETPLDIALKNSKIEIMEFLVDCGARASYISYEVAFIRGIKYSKWDVVKFVWNRRREVRIVDTRPDSWCVKTPVEIAYNLPVWAQIEESHRAEVIECLMRVCDDSYADQNQPLAV